MDRQTGEDTQHEDLREPLDAEAFGASPSALTSAAHLEENIWHQRRRLGRLDAAASRLLTGLSSPSSTSSLVNSLKQSFRVTWPAVFCEEREPIRGLNWSNTPRRPGGTHLSQRDGQIPEGLEDGGGEAADAAGDGAFQLSHKEI